MDSSIRHTERGEHRDDELHEDELERIGDCDRNQHHGKHLRGKGETQIEECTYHDGEYRHRHRQHE